jgi:hypothetical protein
MTVGPYCMCKGQCLVHLCNSFQFLRFYLAQKLRLVCHSQSLTGSQEFGGVSGVRLPFLALVICLSLFDSQYCCRNCKSYCCSIVSKAKGK